MKKVIAHLCIVTLFLIFLTEPVAVNASAGSLQESKTTSIKQEEADKQEEIQSPSADDLEFPSENPDEVKMQNKEKLQDKEKPQGGEKLQDNKKTQEKPALYKVSEGSFSLEIKSASYNKKTVTFEWEKIEDALEYVLLQKTDNGWKEIIRTAKVRGTVPIAKYGEKFTYKLQAYDAEEQLIEESDKIKAVIPVKADRLQTTSISKTKVKLAWAKSKGANSYQVYQKKQGKEKYTLVKTVNKTDINLQVKNNGIYGFKIIPQYRTDTGTIQSKAETITFYNKEFVSLNHQKYTYAEMGSDIKSLCQKYSGYVSCETIGYSTKGRKIYDIILGNPKAKRTLLVISTLHGREYIASAVCMKQIEYYLLNYNTTVDGKKLSDVFQKCNIHYVAMANPDGVTISQTSSSRWKGNANGVNLNLNFPYAFKAGGRKKDNNYSGKSAASEKETKAIIKLTKKLNKTQRLAVVNYHAMGRIVFGGYGGKDSALRSDIRSMYSIARRTTGYADSAGYSGISNGNYRDYLNYSVKVPSITIEVGSVSCPVPLYQYASTYNVNKLVVLREAAWLSKKKVKIKK